MENTPTILGIILAGGQSSRMGQDKAHLKIANKSLFAHCIAKFKAKNIPLAISANQLENYQNQTAYTFIKDDEEFKHQGPLAGILAALNHAKKHHYTYILTIAVDTPFIPLSYIDQLLHDVHGDKQFRLAATNNSLQPTFALWPVSLLKALHNFLLTSDKKSIHGFASLHHADKVVFNDMQQDRAFFNINTVADFHSAKIMGLSDET